MRAKKSRGAGSIMNDRTLKRGGDQEIAAPLK
jgi:hypothetical protein